MPPLRPASRPRVPQVRSQVKIGFCRTSCLLPLLPAHWPLLLDRFGFTGPARLVSFATFFGAASTRLEANDPARDRGRLYILGPIQYIRGPWLHPSDCRLRSPRAIGRLVRA